MPEWKPPTSVRPSKKDRYVLVIPDVHVGYIVDTPTYSIAAWDVMVQALYQLRKRLTDVVILGDFGNWESLSHWSALRADQAFIEEDVALVNARLDELEWITSENGINVAFCEGNHEAWASQFEAKYPAMRDLVNLKRRLHFRERGWRWVPENHFYRLGDLHFTHGHMRGVRQPRDAVKALGCSVVYGHTHAYTTQSVRMLTGEHAAWAMGCLASIDPPPPYSRGGIPESWVHGFGLVQIRRSGRFQVSFRRIIEESWTELEDGTEIRMNRDAVQARYDEDQETRERLREEYSERFYTPGGRVVGLEPHHGKQMKNGDATGGARTKRARVVRGLPRGVK